MNEDELIDEIRKYPCPFCGSDRLDFLYDRTGLLTFVNCANCDAQGPATYAEYPYTEKVRNFAISAKKWINRVTT